MPAAGRGSRFKDKSYKKPFAPLAGRAVWLHSAERFLNRSDVVQVILVIAAEDREDFNFRFASNVAILGIQVVEGGRERADSVAAALARVKPEADFVCVHDAARPCLTDAWIDEIFQAAERTGAAIFAIRGHRHAEAGRRREDRNHGRPRRPLGGADAPGLSPPTAPGRLRPAGGLCRHRRRPVGRAAGPCRGRGARLADQSENHHQGGLAPGGAGAEGVAEAQAARAHPSLCR